MEGGTHAVLEMIDLSHELPEKDRRAFVCLEIFKNPLLNPCQRECLAVSMRYANGEATATDLHAARMIAEGEAGDIEGERAEVVRSGITRHGQENIEQQAMVASAVCFACAPDTFLRIALCMARTAEAM
jgi:hypothetical protein